MFNGSISINPFNGVELGRYPFLTASEVENELARCSQAFKKWREFKIDQRARVLRQMAVVLRRDLPDLAKLITLEMGKPIVQARAEIEKCASLCDWTADQGSKFLQDEPVAMSVGEAYVSYLPIGSVFGVMPWNFPIWQVMRGAVGIIFGGNTYVLKHSTNVMGSAYRLQQAWLESGLPEGVFSVLNVDHIMASKVIKDRRIAGVTVTGSVRAGAAIAAISGAAVKKCVLELGGSDPFIVLADADLDRATTSAVEARFQNTGQVCIAAKRFIVEQSVFDEFKYRFIKKVEAIIVGDPMKPDTDNGPMARWDLRITLDEQVKKSIAEGAKLLCGGGPFLGESYSGGAFYQPTVLSEVNSKMTCFTEEVFGPVAALTKAQDLDDAISLANENDYGLSSALWTADEGRAREIARRLEAGGVFINGSSATDQRLPIGGIKKSGFGRELSHYGLREFLNVQTVWSGRRPEALARPHSE